MNIKVSEKAIHWFQDEMETASGDYVKFFARYGGSSPLHEGFSIGITKEIPDEIAAETVIDGVHFYVEARDLWFFDAHDLHVDTHPASEELAFHYHRTN
ncbi:HesB/YadR/YfhF family protein [Sporosarcina sp. GW1-11]|uniref:HesB/YadR/YfhF family protein n=1 Tax=Sporosarcina sp. GW1-11 TaxID=2899126 RepID=UPI00294FC6D0|nr:HesB/YadR/YfhF family protein [Sporosarcina sp. GW1-11]MDV6377079.1 HesB/YadR/YfhF family protein [Sporosarcina sp. GW1-11]